MRELSISIILYTAGTETISVGVYYLLEFENDSLTSTLAIIQTIILLICLVIFRRIAGREGFEWLNDACFSGGLIRNHYHYDDCVLNEFAERAITENPPALP